MHSPPFKIRFARSAPAVAAFSTVLILAAFPRASVATTETVPHSFTGVEDGSGPLAGLLLDSAGNLYGTTVNGGASGFAGSGVVFKLAGTGFVTTTLPIANAGPNQTVQVGTLVTLDGSASSGPTGQLPLTYAWSFVSKPAGSAMTLSNPAIVHPTFTPDALGNYVIQLVVTDAAGLSSAPATVTISTKDAPPVADAGPNQTITAVGTLVQLNGSASYDLAGLPIAYQWSFVSKPTGSGATLTGPTTSKPSFLADVAGNYILQLVVTDSVGTASSPAEVTVSFSDVPPVANVSANPSSTVVGGNVTLNGSKSTDTDGAPLTYQWSIVSAPSGSTAAISNPKAQIASLVPDLPGTFVVQLIVNDGFLNSLPATTEIEVVSQQTQLTHNIQSLQTVITGLSPSAFRSPRLQQDLIKELNAVLASLTAHEYVRALQQVYRILSEVDGCAISGRPRRSDWITNCQDQSLVVGSLFVIAEEIIIEILRAG